MVKYYLDTCIWIDFFEDRKGSKGEPFGEFASRLLTKIQKENNQIMLSDHLLNEFKRGFSLSSILHILDSLQIEMEGFSYSISQDAEAQRLAKDKNVPFEDALHAILARDSNAILVTRDKHFKKLSSVSNPFKPETLI
ncbi:MAG: PIN domain-containing protein [Nanoarchaeota archaeon]|mgnify:CR=1 FL=1